jgi:hypothetical protein
MIEIVVKAKGRGRFQGYVNGEPIGRPTGQPFYHGARMLVAQGIDPDTELTMRHEKSEIVSMRSTVGRAAKLAVSENENHGPRIVKYKPRPELE